VTSESKADEAHKSLRFLIMPIVDEVEDRVLKGMLKQPLKADGATIVNI